MKISEMQKQCLEALYMMSSPGGEMCVPFSPIERKTSLSRKDVRRTIRALARKGLAEFHFPLMDEDGYFRGAGYCISETGWNYMVDLDAANSL